MDEEMQWIMAWWVALFLAIGLGAYTRNIGIGFLSAGFLGAAIIGVSVIANRWHEIKQLIVARREP